MTQPTRSIFRLWFPLAIGLAAVCVLLLTLRPTAVAAPSQDQPAGVAVLWLVPPETSPASGPWPLAVKAHQAGWQVRSAVVEERLAALKAQGRVVTFEPLLGGVGFVVTAPVGLPPQVRRWPEVARVTAPGEATPEDAAWWRQGLDAASAAQSAPSSGQQVTTLTLNLGLHSHLASGSAPRPEPIALSLTRDGTMIAEATATPFPNGSGGYLYAATLYETYYGGTGGGGGGGYCYPLIEPGDVLQAVQPGQTISLTVPLLTALADQSTASVYGQSPPTATLEVYFYRYGDPGVAYQQTVTATATGDYQADFGGMTPVTPRDYGYVFHADADEAGNHVYASYDVPFLQVGVESTYVGGVVAPCTTITATLHDDAGALHDSYYGCSSSNGAFSVYFYPPSQVSDTVVVTAAGQVVSLTVPALTARPDPASDVVNGEAPVSAPVQVDLYRGPLGYEYTYGPPFGDPDYNLSITATLTGTYAADFTGLADVVAGDYGAVYVTNAAGHQAYRRFAVPFLRACLGNYRLTGQVNGGEQVTVTVWGSSGVPRDVHFVQVYNNGHFYDYDWDGELRLLVGDQVTVTAQDGEETGLAVPLLTAYADLMNSTVSGQAPPSSPLRVGLSRAGRYQTGGGPPDYPSYDYTIWVTSTATGIYTADFSSLTTFQPGHQGAVFYVNPEGHEVYLEFTVPVVRVQSGSNYVAGVLPAESDVAITLRDASGRVKATATTQSGYDGSFEAYLYQNWDVPAIIEAGDTVEVASGDTLTIVTVPTLTVQADCATDVLSGQAPRNVPLDVTWRGGDYWDGSSRTWIVTSTAAGTYALDLGGEVDLERGDEIEVTWTDENGNEVWVAHYVPRLEAALGGNLVYVLGPVYTPLTLTLLSADGALLYTETITLDKSGHAAFYLYDASYDPLLLKADQTLAADLAGEVMTAALPHLTAWADRQADTVSGEASSGARLMVSVNYCWDYWPVTATVAGTYSVDFGGVVDIGTGSSGEVVYLHPDGHRVTLDYAVPHVEVTLEEHYVNGLSPGPGVVTVTLRDAGGGFKGSGVDTSWYSGWFYVYLTDAQQESVPVAGGDQIIVEAAGGVTTFTVPALTAVFDRQTGILTGTAPAMAWLQIALGGGSRQVQAGSGGAYAMDWSDLPPRPGEQGNVAYTDELGNQTRLYFTVPSHNIYLPLIGS